MVGNLSSASVNDLLAGHLNRMVSDVLSVSQHIKAGKLRPLAVTSAKRFALVPDVPTFAGLGVEAHESTQDEFKSFLAAENAKYSKLIADNNVKAE